MRKLLALGALMASTALIPVSHANAAGIGNWQTTVHAANDVQLVRRDGRGDRNWRGGGDRRWGVRTWHRKPHYGNVIAGIALGTIIAAAAANAAPQPPADNLCWYWTNPRHTHGYWDYCG